MVSLHTGPAEPASFRQAMRQLAGGVSVITAASKGSRTGMTVTSVISVAMEPPELLVSVNERSSSWPVIQATRRFGVSVLASHQSEVARRFSGQCGEQGEQRFEGAQWHCTPDGVWLMIGALAAFSCEVVQVYTHRGHALVVGRVNALSALAPDGGPLSYWQGDYGRFSKLVGREIPSLEPSIQE